MKLKLSRETVFDLAASQACGVECYRTGRPQLTLTFSIPEWLCRLIGRYKSRGLRFHKDAFSMVWGTAIQSVPGDPRLNQHQWTTASQPQGLRRKGKTGPFTGIGLRKFEEERYDTTVGRSVADEL